MRLNIFIIVWGISMVVHQAKAEVCDGRLTWNGMIEAKGGQIRLDSIESFFVKGVNTSWHGLARRRVESIEFYRFPKFAWSWFDHGTSTLGASVTTFYGDRGITLRDNGSRVVQMPSVDTPLQEVPVLLLQTRWMRPSIEDCSTVGRSTALNIRFSGIPYQVTFHLQGNSRLPNKVEIKHADATDVYRLANYHLVEGLMMPTKFIHQYGRLPALVLDLDYEINPDYDPAILNREPSLAAGRDAWRRPR